MYELRSVVGTVQAAWAAMPLRDPMRPYLDVRPNPSQQLLTSPIQPIPDPSPLSRPLTRPPPQPYALCSANEAKHKALYV